MLITLVLSLALLPAAADRPAERPTPVSIHAESVLHSSETGEALAARESAGPDIFDQIQPGPTAVVGHLFTDRSGVPYPPAANPTLGGVASVIQPSSTGNVMTFPYALDAVWNVRADEGGNGWGVRNYLVQGALNVAEPTYCCSPYTVDAPAPHQTTLSVYPNPFNPVTTISFTALAGSQGSVKVYNLRGELVRTLHSGEFQVQDFRWDGADERGKGVASGVYVVKAETGSQQFTQKIALVR